MKVFTKLRHYEVPSTSSQQPEENIQVGPCSSSLPCDTSGSLSLNVPPSGKTLMWVTASPTHQPQSPCSKCWRHFYRIAQPTLRTLGQCMFGIAMLFIMAGIALCIWGYVGEAIRPFQIFGPVCIGIGLFIYFIGCVLCCREYPAFEKTLQERAKQEKARRAVDVLGDKTVTEWIQNDPEVYEDFKEVASRILHHQPYFTDSGNIIANVYAHNADLEGEPS